jgi:hypothetical protein
MVALSSKFMNRGVYSVGSASKITEIPPQRIRRWTQGYVYRYRGRQFRSPPAIAAQMGRVGSRAILEFADLLEVRLLEYYRSLGMSWRTIRIATDRARRLFGDPHPYLTARFRTDGQRIFAEMTDGSGDPVLLDLVDNKYEFSRILDQFLVENVDHDREGPFRFYPLGRSARVIVDRRMRFGAPIVVEGVPTSVLAQALRAEGSIEAAARWYQVHQRSVQDAVRFEDR